MAHEHHSHAPTTASAAFAIGVALNVAYILAQIIFGIVAHSLALIADAGHNFGDVLGLLVAWCAIYLGIFLVYLLAATAGVWAFYAHVNPVKAARDDRAAGADRRTAHLAAQHRESVRDRGRPYLRAAPHHR